jgi:molybdate transport system ATP-binding protein
MLWSPVTAAYPVMTARMVIDGRRPGEAAPTVVDAIGAAAPAVASETAGVASDGDLGPAAHLTHGLGINHLLDRPVRTLSTGEMKKVLLVAALAKRPDLLLLDEPFDGLDAESRDWFAHILPEFVGGTGGEGAATTLVLATHREDEIVMPISRYAALRDGRLVETGRVDRTGDLRVPGLAAGPAAGSRLSILRASPVPPAALVEQAHSARAEPAGRRNGDRQPPSEAEAPLIEMKQVSVHYNGQTVLDGLDWVMRRGENWSITGPNGSGKTTLLNLICGDNLQAYSNDIRLFGRQRGSGESIWEIKAKIGYVTPHLQARYDSSITAREVVVSGFYDSIGLYRHPTVEQEDRFGELMREMGLAHLGDTAFDRLSSGERTLFLIARAMVKRPRVLILDEPCQGLDPVRRGEILGAVERVGLGPTTDIIYVTHRADEIPGCVTRRLELGTQVVHKL